MLPPAAQKRQVSTTFKPEKATLLADKAWATQRPRNYEVISLPKLYDNVVSEESKEEDEEAQDITMTARSAVRSRRSKSPRREDSQ